jgi:hypothetical protein
MKDIELARSLLDSEKQSIVIVKEGRVIFSSDGKGIKPLYTALKELKSELRGSSVADKVVGKAAAMICDYAGIKELSTKLISENAINALENTYIIYNYEKCVPYIKNRDQSGMCPVETLSLKVNNIDELLIGVSNFLKSIER